MDVQEAYREHYKMWDWLVRHPYKSKEDYFKNTKKVVGNCYLCEEY